MADSRKALRAIFDEALEIVDEVQRRAYLEEACAGDAALQRAVEELLRSEASAGGFLAGRPPEAPVVNGGATEQEGDRIGRYKLLQRIGEGGCGIVYMAEQTEPVKRRVALKIIKLGMDTRSVVARFEAERQALALMDHPYVARALDAGATDTGRPFFVMELVRGIKITEYCEQNRLSTQARLQLFVQVCQAVQHAHQKGIIHRDLKPSNILVTSNEGGAIPKVIDFGIAKATADIQLTDKTLFTRYEMFIGTPAYMSPEQAEFNASDIDTRTDIYALGVLLYELLTGCPPFDSAELISQGIDAMRRTLREQDPPKPSTRLAKVLTAEAAQRRKTSRGFTHRRSDLSNITSHQLRGLRERIALLRGDLDWIVLKAIEKDRTRRYETASGLAADIQRHLSNEPVFARPPSAGYRIRKAFQRNRLAFSAVAAVAIVLLVGVGVSAWLAVEATRAKERALLAEAARALEAQQAQGERNKAQELQRRAEAGERAANQLLYAADMHLARQAWDERNPERVQELLRETASYPSRRFEWYYWLRRLHLDLRTFAAHDGPVRSVAFSPDGQRVLTGSEDGMAKVWSATRGEELFSLLGHTGRVTAVRFSSEGERIATGGSDATARVWDAVSGKELLLLRGHSRPVTSVAFVPKAKKIVTTSEDGTARVWDLDRGTPLARLGNPGRKLLCAALSPDGRRVAFGDDLGNAELWDLLTSTRLRGFTGHSKHVYAITISPDGTSLLTGSADHSFRLWNIETGEMRLEKRAHSDRVMAVAFSPDGRKMLTGSDDHTAKVWDSATGQELAEFVGHARIVVAVAFSPDGREVLTGSYDRTAKLWDAIPDDERHLLKGHGGGVYSVQLSHDGRRCVTGSADRTAKVWSVATGRVLLDLQGHTDAVYAVAFSPDDRFVITGSDDRTARIWDSGSGRMLREFRGHSNLVRAVAFSPDGQRVVTGGDDHRARVWDASTGSEFVTLRGHTDTVKTAVFSPDGRRILTASRDKSVRLWNAATGTEEAVLLPTDTIYEGVHSAAFSPDGLRIVTAGGHRATVWELAGNKPVLELIVHGHEVFTAAFSADGQRIVTSGDDKVLRIWEAVTGHEVLSLKGHNRTVRCAVFSADGRAVFSGSEDTTVRIWQAATDPDASGWETEIMSIGRP